MNRTIILLVILIAFCFNLESQEKDFGIWYGINGDLELIKDLDLELAASLRTFENASAIEQIFGEIGLKYKPFRFLSLAASYRMTGKSEDDKEYHPRHKFFADINGEIDIRRFTVESRLRYQRQDKTYFEDPDDEVPDHYGRIRLRTTYRTPSFPVNPFISGEIFLRLFETPKHQPDKFRLSAGADYEFSKRHSIELEYIFERDYIPDHIDTSIISVAYCFNF